MQNLKITKRHNPCGFDTIDIDILDSGLKITGCVPKDFDESSDFRDYCFNYKIVCKQTNIYLEATIRKLSEELFVSEISIYHINNSSLNEFLTLPKAVLFEDLIRAATTDDQSFKGVNNNIKIPVSKTLADCKNEYDNLSLLEKAKSVIDSLYNTGTLLSTDLKTKSYKYYVHSVLKEFITDNSTNIRIDLTHKTISAKNEDVVFNVPWEACMLYGINVIRDLKKELGRIHFLINGNEISQVEGTILFYNLHERLYKSYPLHTAKYKFLLDMGAVSTIPQELQTDLSVKNEDESEKYVKGIKVVFPKEARSVLDSVVKAKSRESIRKDFSTKFGSISQKF